MNARLLLLFATAGLMPTRCPAQSADWQSVVWREPQVPYLLADMTIGGKTDLYRKYALEEKDPDSREAIRLWDAGARVVNTNDFERKWIPSQYAKDGKMLRIVHRGWDRTITGHEVLLSSDYAFQQVPVRLVIAELSMGRSPKFYEAKKKDPNVAEALHRWAAGARALNTNQFEWGGVKMRPPDILQYHGTHVPIDGAYVRLNCDLASPEVNVRYFLADMQLGGSRDFYWRTADIAHEMGCLEAVLRHDAGVKITNLDQFERQQVAGKTLITRKGSTERSSGIQVKLSTDLP